jgi:Protein of unknown function (DUF2815)
MGEEKVKPSNMTPHFRVAYPVVFKPKLNELSKKEEYTLTCLFPKGTDLSGLKALAQAAIIKKWGEDKTKWPKDLQSPFKDQAEFKNQTTGKMYDGAEPGCTMIRLKSYQQPVVFDQQKNEILEERHFYGGCFARATVNAFAFDQGKNRGISFWFNAVQKVKEGDPLGGRANPESDFEPVEGLANEKVSDASSLFS